MKLNVFGGGLNSKFDQAQHAADREQAASAGSRTGVPLSLTSQFGAKAVGLIELRYAEQHFRHTADADSIRFAVPHFNLIDVNTYHDYLSRKNIQEALAEPYARHAGVPMIVRSSGVYAEDGETLGAGIYKSVVLDEDASFEDFVSAVCEIYESVDSPLARRYRAENGIHSEDMGIVVQHYIDGKGSQKTVRGYVNSQRPGIDRVLDVVFELTPEEDAPATVFNSSLSYALRREEIASGDLIDPADESYLFFTSDYSRAKATPMEALAAARVTLFLEEHFRQKLQIEFVKTDDRLYVVQARPLPAKWLQGRKVHFPDRADWLWRSQSLGIIDEKLPVLTQGDNAGRKGLLVINSPYGATRHEGWIERILPDSGAILLLKNSEYLRGHFESRALEKGLAIITADRLDDEKMFETYPHRIRAALGYYEDDSEVPPHPFRKKLQILSPNDNEQLFHVVSNGTEARIYLVERD